MKTEEKVFTFFLLGIVTLMLFLTFKYRSGAKLVPLFIGILALALMLFLCAMAISPRFASWYQKLEKNSLTSLKATSLEAKIKDIGDLEEKVDQRAVEKKEKIIVGWLLFLTAAVYALGFLVAIPLFLFLFLKIWGKEGWVLTLTLSGTVSVIIYFIFDFILKIPFHEGIIFR